jgi:hypothetical protein
MLGHSSPQTTARYAAYDKSGVADMVEQMDAAWSRPAEAPAPEVTDKVSASTAGRPTVNDLGLLHGRQR